MPPLTSQQTFAVAVQHHQSGRAGHAEQLCRQLLKDDPHHADAMNLLGVIAHHARRRGEAVIWLGRAAGHRPDDPAVQLNYGATLLANSRAADAVTPLSRAVVLAPGLAEAHLQLGAALLGAGQLAEAVDSLRRATELQPTDADAWNNLGVAEFRRNQWQSALDAFRRTVALRPDAVDAQKNLAMALQQAGEPDAALAALETAARLRPSDSDTQNKLAVLHEHARRWQLAIEHYDRSIELDPGAAPPQWNLARLLLLLGDFSRAWPLFEARLRIPYLKLARDFSQPQWRGEPIAGKTILLWTEGGFGDALNFIRFAPLIAARGAVVLLECQPELANLLASVPSIAAVFSRGAALPPFDLQCPLQSLMLAFGTTEQTIPTAVSYLRPDPARIEWWRDRWATNRTLKVGLAWAGSANPNDMRSRTLATFAPLLSVAKVNFYRVQQGLEAAEIPPLGMTLLDAVEPGFDFAETAALVCNLDLVITIDTSVGHLAGALGIPVWVLLPASPDFRWMLDRSDTRWYPTMTLFRQERAGSWAEPVAAMVGRLREMTAR